MTFAETDTAMPTVFDVPKPTDDLEFTGERYVSGLAGEIQSEHYHRYFFALGFCAGRDVLDIASGEGYGSALLGQVARNVVGVDNDMNAVQFANRNYMSKRVSFRLGDAAELPLATHSVDVVVSFETLEHILKQETFLQEIKRVLRPDGILIMSSPNKDLYLKDQKEENPFHLKELNKTEFKDIIGGSFQNVTILEQRAFTGSVIIREGGKTQTAVTEGFGTADCKRFTKSEGVPEAPYLLAVASDKGELSVPDSLFYHPGWIWRLEELRLQADARANAAVADQDSILARCTAAEISTAELSREVKALQTACEKAELAALLATQGSHSSYQQDLLRRGDEVAMLRNSTSWRITAPLRAVVLAIKRLLGR